ncbi:hypothetical protein QQX98_005875 [Neonectria punicea]|uniref:Uncharacterized protein n=1 Tax=Neonectria punicea TaxID=979145 RepID=A0ABR1H2Z6_9HYPO
MKTPKPKRRPRSQDSIEFNHRPFSDFQSSPVPSRELSTFSWVDDALALTPESPTKHRSTNHPIPRMSELVDASSPVRGQVSPSETGGLMTRFVQIRNEMNSAPLPMRPLVKATGAHDDSLARSQGQYRDPSLRRGSGMSVQTPEGLRKDIDKRQKDGTWPNPQAQEEATVTGSSSSQDKPVEVDGPSDANVQTQANATKASLPKITDWDDVPHRFRRGDVPPLIRIRGPIALFGFQLSFSEKTHVLDVCYSLRTVYLGLPRQITQSEEEFWVEVLARLEPTSGSRYRFRNWETLQSNVNFWCDVRRMELRAGNLSPPKDFRRDLDLAIDEWNRVWLDRFCSVNRGCFAATIWPDMEDKVLSLVRSELFDWTNTVLQKRREELETLARPKLLPGNSNLEEYSRFVGLLECTIKSGGRNSFEIREAEAIMSFVTDLQPRLRKVLHQHLNPGTANQEAEDSAVGLETIDEDSESDESQSDEVLPSIETPVTSPQTLARPRAHEKQSLQSETSTKQPSPPPDEGSGRLTKKRKASQEALPKTLPKRLSVSLPKSPSVSLPEPLPEPLPELRPVAQHTPSQQQRPDLMSQPHIDSLRLDSPLSVSTSDPTTPNSSGPSSLNSTPLELKAKSPVRDGGECATALKKENELTHDMEPPEGTEATQARGVSQEAKITPTGPRQQYSLQTPQRPNQGRPWGYGNPRNSQHSRGRSSWNNRHNRYNNNNPGRREWHGRSNSSRSSQFSRGGTFRGNTRPSLQNNRNTEHRNEDSSPLRFRESTADFRAMAPGSREVMMFRALKTVIQNTRRE